ncbi:unnamed protein product [Dovyalis caffra]|uniref:Uncharacterized protein n=1 Tax=Dovyalis caffra TaxID=77055 RepID=A0AAV1QVT7_9ROSI|nr:unnamed protein product [Dovyalis caffra]
MDHRLVFQSPDIQKHGSGAATRWHLVQNAASSPSQWSRQTVSRLGITSSRIASLLCLIFPKGGEGEESGDEGKSEGKAYPLSPTYPSRTALRHEVDKKIGADFVDEVQYPTLIAKKVCVKGGTFLVLPPSLNHLQGAKERGAGAEKRLLSALALGA